jgi:outer membrane protein insertion porin family
MRFSAPLLLAGLLLATPLAAQEPVGACATPDTLIVRGNSRVSDASIRGDAGLTPGAPLSALGVQRAIRDLFATGQFDDVRLACVVDAEDRASIVLEVRERPVLGDVRVEGAEQVAGRAVREQVDLIVGRPIDPAAVARVVGKIDSLYEARGYYLARVLPETTVVEGTTALVFRIDEGRRLAVSGVRVDGNESLGDEDVVGAMETKPEGFWWFRRGEFDEDKYAGDLAERIPQLYAQRGYIDFQIVDDTLVVDRDRGKALVRLEVDEGVRYRVGDFAVVGNRVFSSEDIARFYPFSEEGPTLTQRVSDIIRRRSTDYDVFDRGRWDEATQSVRTAYNNEGYIYAQVRPVVERAGLTTDSVPIVNLRWEIDEGRPAIINRIEIAGNDYTYESCIRDQLIILPGDVFNQDRLIRSYQNIANLGFFETPLPPPDTRQANEQGDVDVIFTLKEKRTGNINFGASVGQGTGVGGFIGLDQPNLFGQCKRGSLQWQYGRYINDFNLSYTDPTIKQSRISGTVNVYRSEARYRIADLGQSVRTGGQLQFGFPLPRTPFTRLFLSYGGEGVRYKGATSELLSSVDCDEGSECFRSTLGLTVDRDTRIDLPFATGGTRQTLTSQFTGGLLGGGADFQRYTGEIRAYAPIGQFGGDRPGSSPIRFVLGLTGRAGALFGDPGAFFFSQQFALGGVQFGEPLRGYGEFCITPGGVRGGSGQCNAQRASFGSAYFSSTAEFGVRVNQMFYVNLFYDAGNVWNKPREFDPTRLYRGAGIGLSTITPLGPLGLDYAYGFDRVDAQGRPRPGWQLHFRLGQFF